MVCCQTRSGKKTEKRESISEILRNYKCINCTANYLQYMIKLNYTFHNEYSCLIYIYIYVHTKHFHVSVLALENQERLCVVLAFFGNMWASKYL